MNGESTIDIREDAGMYVTTSDIRGIADLQRDLLLTVFNQAKSLDRELKINLTYFPDNFFELRDNGNGLDIGSLEESPSLFRTERDRGRFNLLVNIALAEIAELTSVTSDSITKLVYEQGKLISQNILPRLNNEELGTLIRMRYDRSVITHKLDYFDASEVESPFIPSSVIAVAKSKLAFYPNINFTFEWDLPESAPPIDYTPKGLFKLNKGNYSIDSLLSKHAISKVYEVDTYVTDPEVDPIKVYFTLISTYLPCTGLTFRAWHDRFLDYHDDFDSLFRGAISDLGVLDKMGATSINMLTQSRSKHCVGAVLNATIIINDDDHDAFITRLKSEIEKVLK